LSATGIDMKVLYLFACQVQTEMQELNLCDTQNKLNFKNMKKKILGGIALLAIAAVAVWNVSLNSQSNDL
jgi:hypothetical protein